MCKCKTLIVVIVMLHLLLQGFKILKDTTISLKKHEDSSCNKLAVEVIVTLPKTTINVADLL